MTQPMRMRASRSVLVLVDYQERLMPAIHDAPAVLERAVFLAKVATELAVPVVATEQNPARLGPNVPPLPSYVGHTVAKMTFAGCGPNLDAALGAAPADAAPGDAARADAADVEPAEVVIAGCEAHVCLLQTALGLLEAGRRVWVVADACGSRHPADREAALGRLAAAGAGLVTAEMVAFEWLATAEHPRFRAVSALVKGL